jgi:hypothetical protein
MGALGTYRGADASEMHISHLCNAYNDTAYCFCSKQLSNCSHLLDWERDKTVSIQTSFGKQGPNQRVRAV